MAGFNLFHGLSNAARRGGADIEDNPRIRVSLKQVACSGMWFVFFVGLALFYEMAYPSHLLWQEQNQIFLNSSDWSATYFERPAFIGCFVGDWLTQFYSNVAVGALILTSAVTLCVALFAVGMKRLHLRISAWVLTTVFAALMVSCSFASSTRLSFFICVAGGLGLGLAELLLPQRRIEIIGMAPLLVVLAYFCFGFGVLLTVWLIVMASVKRVFSSGWTRWCWVRPLVAVAFCLTLPLSYSGVLPYEKGLLYPGPASPSMPQMLSEERMAIADAFYKRDFAKAKRLAEDASSPDDVIAFYYYLSSAMQDSLPECLLRYPVRNLGTLTSISDKSPLTVINMMNDLYYELGDMTYAERAAMMRNVFSPRNRNVRMIQRLAEVNLVSGDTLAALKYLRILDRTHSYADWSSSHIPGSMEPDVEADIMRRRACSNAKDNIRLGDNARNIILELLESNPGNTVALDYLLCTDLLLKDMDTFKMDYDTYCMAKGAPRYRDLYQQALMIYLAGTDAPQEEWDRYIVSGPQLQAFRAYSSRRGDPAFKDTYWYYFDRYKNS
ncbi:MAG: hypothetical protein K2J58_00620 [Muribaculaceae bacterium]|nr:hypothetical protein [Muribaculaceae bacterium]